MTNVNKTTIALFISFCLLCIWFFASNQIIHKVCYSDMLPKVLSAYSKSFLGRIILNHYVGGKDAGYLISNYSVQKFIEKANFISTGALTLFMVFFSIWLIFLNTTNREERDSKGRGLLWVLFLIVLNGTAIRLILAYECYGSYDMASWEIVSKIFINGGNVYTETNRYNYSPIWFMTLGFLKKIQLQLSFLPFHFIVRCFLTGIDLLILFFLILIARLERISIIRTSVFFYLNPVSFLLTGYHGQFDNFAVLMVVVGLFIYFNLQNKPILRKMMLWGFATLGMLIKHIIFYEVIICLNFIFKRYRTKALFMLSVLGFLFLFLPYWRDAYSQIIKNVFMYSSGIGVYGITSLFKFNMLKYLFVLGLFIFPFFLHSKDLVKRCLQGILFFLSFTTGIAIQYFALPISLGALRPSNGFIAYSALSALFILGSNINLHIPLFSYLNWNIVWLVAIFWFITSFYENALKSIERPGA